MAAALGSTSNKPAVGQSWSYSRLQGVVSPLTNVSGDNSLRMLPQLDL
jgi:hypothetical protein